MSGPLKLKLDYIDTNTNQLLGKKQLLKFNGQIDIHYSRFSKEPEKPNNSEKSFSGVRPPRKIDIHSNE